MTEGFIFINEKGNRLTRGKWWGFENSGWIFNHEERDEIMEEAKSWTTKPAYVQRAKLNNKEVITLGDQIPCVI